MKRTVLMIALSLFVVSSINILLDATAYTQETIHKPAEKIYILKEEGDRPWWIGDAVTVFSILVSVLIIRFQMKKQHEGELEVQKENSRDTLRLEIYQEFSEVLSDAASKNSDVGMYAYLIPVHLKNYRDQVNSGLNPLPTKDRAQSFLQRHQSASDASIKLMRLIEKYEIVSPELEIFKTAINVVIHDMREAFVALHLSLSSILPVEVLTPQGDTQTGNIATPTEDQLQNLDKLVNKYKSASDDMLSYLFDFNVELQNIFLKNLFNNTVKKREPLDPSMKVITTEPHEVAKLNRYFDEETSWGKAKKESEKNVLYNLKNSNG